MQDKNEPKFDAVFTSMVFMLLIFISCIPLSILVSSYFDTKQPMTFAVLFAIIEIVVGIPMVFVWDKEEKRLYNQSSNMNEPNISQTEFCKTPTKPFTKIDSPKLPRTWGRELLLLVNKENRQRVWHSTFIGGYLFIAIVGSIGGLFPAFGVVIFRNGTISLDVLTLFGYLYLIIFTLIGIIGIIYYLASARKVLRSVLFSQLADKKLEVCNSKTEALKKQLPDPHFRIASFPSPKDAIQLRDLLEADHPLSREQRAEAEALLKAQTELEEAQHYAELAQAQIKSQTS